MGDEKRKTGIEAVLVRSTEPAELAEFYRRGLDLPEAVPHGDDHLGYRVPGGYLGFDRVPETEPGPGRTAVWFGVADARATFEKLLELGGTPEEAPFQGGSEILASVRDPEGNLIGLIEQVGRGAT